LVEEFTIEMLFQEFGSKFLKGEEEEGEDEGEHFQKFG
jgi:hypothetical protein